MFSFLSYKSFTISFFSFIMRNSGLVEKVLTIYYLRIHPNTHTHFFLTCFDLMKPNKGKTHDPASMKRLPIRHILQTLSGFCILFYTQYIISFPIKKLVNLFAFKIRFYQFSSKKDQVKIATKYKLDV